MIISAYDEGFTEEYYESIYEIYEENMKQYINTRNRTQPTLHRLRHRRISSPQSSSGCKQHGGALGRSCGSRPGGGDARHSGGGQLGVPERQRLRPGLQPAEPDQQLQRPVPWTELDLSAADRAHVAE